MVHIHATSAKLLMSCKSRLHCHATVFVRRCITFPAAGRKQQQLYALSGKFCCPYLLVTSSVVRCRLKSDSTVNAADHLAEMGMPRSDCDAQRLAENVAARHMNVNVDSLVRLLSLAC